jgi:hypothetical protein
VRTSWGLWFDNYGLLGREGWQISKVALCCCHAAEHRNRGRLADSRDCISAQRQGTLLAIGDGKQMHKASCVLEAMMGASVQLGFVEFSGPDSGTHVLWCAQSHSMLEWNARAQLALCVQVERCT